MTGHFLLFLNDNKGKGLYRVRQPEGIRHDMLNSKILFLLGAFYELK